MRRLGEDVLGKGVVLGKDTPNFIGNRIGTHAMMAAIHQMLADGLAPEDVDAITGPAMGHPKSASFRTGDIVGLDTLVHVADNCFAALTERRGARRLRGAERTSARWSRRSSSATRPRAASTRRARTARSRPSIRTSSSTAPKGGDEAIKKATKSIEKIEDPARARAASSSPIPGKAGQLAWKVLSRSLAYSARRIGEIADSIVAIDDAMRWGYNWELGPFETWDALGFAETADRMEKDGIALPASITDDERRGRHRASTRAAQVFDLVKGDVRRQLEVDPRTATLRDPAQGRQRRCSKNDGAEAWDLGDGVLGLTFKTQGEQHRRRRHRACSARRSSKAESDFRALVIANQGEHFCVGANLFLVVMAATQQGQWGRSATMVEELQDDGRSG